MMAILMTLMTITAMLLLLIFEVFDPIKVFILALSVFLLMGFITIEEATHGFSNKGVLAVAVLYIIAGSIENSSYFHKLTNFSNLDKDKFNPIKLFLTITGLSAFLNNTPIVSIFIPITKKIAKKTGISASKLLIPISYLSILGGILTLIGTSTNLVISGLMEEMGLNPLGFFELTKVALPSSLFGILYIYLFYNKRLPDNSEALENSKKRTNEHIIKFVIKNQSSIIGKTIEEANLRKLSGLYLIEIERDNSRLFPITPDEVLQEEDVLVFTGQTDEVEELRNINNLVLETEDESHSNYFEHDNTIILEAVLTQHIGIMNYTINESNFKEKYNAVIIGVIRNGEILQEKIGSIRPKLGDTFLIIADKSSTGFIEEDPSFTIVNIESREMTSHTIKSYIPFVAFIGAILFTLLLNLNILYTAFLGVAFMLITNTVEIKEAIKMVEYHTIILIALSFGVGAAMMNTGTANFIAQSLNPLIIHLHPLLIMGVVFIITNFFTTIITNNAAAVLALPIVYEITTLTSHNIRPFLLVMAIAASSAFLSPYGYQTNTMVYGAGGYQFKDFIKFGFPLAIIVMFSSIISAYLLYF